MLTRTTQRGEVSGRSGAWTLLIGWLCLSPLNATVAHAGDVFKHHTRMPAHLVKIQRDVERCMQIPPQHPPRIAFDAAVRCRDGQQRCLRTFPQFHGMFWSVTPPLVILTNAPGALEILPHELVHYGLWRTTGDLDPRHNSALFIHCGGSDGCRAE